MPPHPRSQTYYWKCDRPAAFHGTDERPRDRTGLEGVLTEALRRRFPQSDVTVTAVATQGNHLTFLADIGGAIRFVRIDDGPERDDYLEVESHLLESVRGLGVPSPQVFAVDASRRDVPFAWQVMERIEAPDLNKHFKDGTLDGPAIFRQLGALVARWQAVEPAGFGPFDPAVLRGEQRLQGFHATYAAYFHLHLERHLAFLVDRKFLTAAEADAMRAAIAAASELLELPQARLVHKDLALWNVLGTPTKIEAVIDWDDAIGGDPMDDLSLLACFHDATTMAAAVAGYETVRPLPTDARRRFWLHLLRNMLFKSVIRVGAGYFDRTDNFFLITAGSSGQSLRDFTHERLMTAVEGLRGNARMDVL